MNNKIINSLKKSHFVNILRNKFLIRPSLYLKPKNNDLAVSDFFFWRCKDSFQTKFYITNLASQILPEIPQNDEISIFIYNNYGVKIDHIEINLNPFQTIEFIFDIKKFQDMYGSFFIFHKFKNLGDLLVNNCHVAERGYTGYKKGDGVWNFVHGNHYSASLLPNNKIQSLVSTSLLKSNYKMQVSFSDSIRNELVINNPGDKKISYEILYFNENMKYIDKDVFSLKGLNTSIHELSKKKFQYIEIKSNIIFCRPLVIKYYDHYFDVFHA